jgi:5-methylcytosine-specific restriction endonuclease McrA
MRTCNRCRETFPVADFGRDKSQRDGLNRRCKACVRTNFRKAYAADPVKFNARNRTTKARLRQDPAYRDQERAYKSEYMPAYRRQRRNDPTTRDQVLAQDRQDSQRRRARKLSAPVESFTPEELYAAWDDAGYAGCYWCDEPFTAADPLHVDHLTPVSKGGAEAVWNLVPAHMTCNSSKHDKDPYAYALERYPWLAAS